MRHGLDRQDVGDFAPIAFVVLVFAVVVCLFADCAAGTTRYFHCQVTGHGYVAAYDTTSTDEDGNSDTTHHDEEFHLYCQDCAGSATYDVEVASWRYQDTADTALVWVRVRAGKWTGAHYLPTLVDQPPNAEK